MGKVLTTKSRLVCPHQGQIDVSTTGNQRVFVGDGAQGGLALLVDDAPRVSGCAFMQGNKPSPCVAVEWVRAPGDVRADETVLVTESTIGTCRNAERAAQGIATLVDAQALVDVGE